MTDHDDFVFVTSNLFQFNLIVSSFISHCLCLHNIQQTAFVCIVLSDILSPLQANTADLKNQFDVQRSLYYITRGISYQNVEIYISMKPIPQTKLPKLTR